jgi:hypothetical protein
VVDFCVGKYMEGGVKKLDDTLSSFDAVQAMIVSRDARITALSYASLSGFLFRLDAPTASSFLGLNASGTQFSRPIHSLVLKIALVVDNKDVKKLPPFEINGQKRNKKIELLDDFSVECVVQQTIYKKTLTPNGKPICLSVADFSYFDDSESRKLLALLKSKTTDLDALEMIEYLKTHISATVNLGMITMQLADGFVTIGTLKQNRQDTAFEQACLRSLAQTMILFITLKMVNYDCHVGNILATDDESFLIDFGRVLAVPQLTNLSDFKQAYNLLSDIRGTVSYDDDWEQVKNVQITDLYVTKSKETSRVVERLRQLLLFITRVDQAFNYIQFRTIKPSNAALFHFIYDQGDAEYAKLVKIIHVIRELTQTPTTGVNKLSAHAVQAMIQSGRLFSLRDGNFKRNIHTKRKRTSPSSQTMRKRTSPSTTSTAQTRMDTKVDEFDPYFDPILSI